MSRQAIFDSYREHPWLKRVYSRLTKQELEFVAAFIRSHNDLNKGEFELRVNRLFINQSPGLKHWREVLELLTCSNSAL